MPKQDKIQGSTVIKKIF